MVRLCTCDSRPQAATASCILRKTTREHVTNGTSLTAWLLAGKVSRLVLAIISKESREVVERWQFDIALESASTSSHGNPEEAKENAAPE